MSRAVSWRFSKKNEKLGNLGHRFVQQRDRRRNGESQALLGHRESGEPSAQSPHWAG